MSTRTVQDTLDTNFSISITHLPSNDTVSFSAYLTKFQDAFSQTWNSEEVYGRMDPIYMFKNTKRKLQISFDVPSEDQTDGQVNFRKISKMIKYSYPTYVRPGKSQTIGDIQTGAAKTTQTSPFSNALLISTPPLFGVRFANLIRSNTGKLVCKIDNFSFDLDTESGYFAKNGNLYAMIYKVDLSLDVIHTDPLGWEKDERGNIVQRTKNFPYGV